MLFFRENPCIIPLTLNHKTREKLLKLSLQFRDKTNRRLRLLSYIKMSIHRNKKMILKNSTKIFSAKVEVET